jgi:hypothetical protein
VDLKVTSKQCFGSAGCSVLVEPHLTYTKNLSDLNGQSCQITYSITGDESGEVIGTVSSVGSELTVRSSAISTPKSATPVTATVTAVDCN